METGPLRAVLVPSPSWASVLPELTKPRHTVRPTLAEATLERLQVANGGEELGRNPECLPHLKSDPELRKRKEHLPTAHLGAAWDVAMAQAWLPPVASLAAVTIPPRSHCGVGML